MKNTKDIDIIKQTIELFLESDGIDHLNNWITDCNYKEKEAFLQLAYDPWAIFDPEKVEWKYDFKYRLLDSNFPDEFLILPIGPNEPGPVIQTQHDVEQDQIQNDYETAPISVRPDLGDGIEDNENIFSATEATA